MHRSWQCRQLWISRHRGARLAGVGGYRTIGLVEVLVRNTLDVFSSHCLNFGAFLVDFAPIAKGFSLCQLDEQEEVALQAAIAVCHCLILDLLQLPRWDCFGLQLLQFRVPAFLQLHRSGITLGLRVKRKRSGVLARVLLRAGAACHLAAFNHVLVQTTSATIEDRTHDIQRI